MTFPAEETTAAVTIPVVQDDILEGVCVFVCVRGVCMVCGVSGSYIKHVT